MAFFNEFPHTRTYDSDLGWLIKEMFELLTNWNGTKEEWEELQKEFQELVNNLGSDISNILEEWKESGKLADIATLYNGLNIFSSAVTNPIMLPKKSSEWTETDLTNKNTSYFYSLYNELASEFSNNLQYILYGNDESGEPLAYYKWTPNYMLKNPSATIFTNTGKKPCLIISSGVHGEEKESIISLYRIFNDWLHGKNNGKYILDTFTIYIMPCVNPYGINNNERLNQNGIDINRNFPAGFTSGGTHGATALSEQSSKFVDFVFNKAIDELNSQTILFYDCHNFTRYASDPAGTTLYFNVSYRSMYENLPLTLLSAAHYLQNAITNIYPELDNTDFIKLLGMGNEGTLTDYADSLGIPATLIETPINFVQETAYTNKSAKIAYLIIANSILITSGNYLKIVSGNYSYTKNQLGANSANTLQELWEKVPRGNIVQYEVDGSATIKNDLPNNYKSTLIIFKGFSDSNFGLILFVNTGISNPRPYFANVQNNDISEWFSMLPSWGGPDFSDEDLATLDSLYAAIKPGQRAVIRVITGMDLINSMPVTDQSGQLEIIVPYVRSSYTKTAIAYYITDDNKFYYARAYNDSFAAWQGPVTI